MIWLVEDGFTKKIQVLMNEGLLRKFKGDVINTDDDGLSDLNYSVVRTEKLFETDHEIIDFKCEGDIPDHVEF